ncbi:hypothetical protein ACHWQZ_G011768 [Mnemiopsis leidyi]
MVFNKTGRQLQESHGFKYGRITIPAARTYCYLGIVFNLNGSTTAATDELRKKGLKAYFALKSIINLGELSTRSVFKLFDALILPVVSYGCQTWLQETNFVKAVISEVDGKRILQKLAADPLEKLHLRFLKWTLQVHKKCANLTCYGDTGRFPLVIQLAKQAISYFNRLRDLDKTRSKSFVRHAFAEQRINKLTWQLQESHGFKYGRITIPAARTYCYLGIVFNLNGSTTAATDELRKKGLKAYFALKSIINLGELSTRSVFKLFDALILPVVSYGCQTWLQETNFVKAVISEVDGKRILQKLAADPLEKLHLRFLKWTLQVHKKCANLTCYGDTGRFPLVIQLAKQAISYFNRLRDLDKTRSKSFVRHAFAEQRINKLTWYQNTIKLLEIAGHHHQTDSACPTRIKLKLQEHFNQLWEVERHKSSKLSYYNQVKRTPHIHYEDFLDLVCTEDRKCLMRLRSSSHGFNCETGRYVTDKELATSNALKSWYKRCEFCVSDDTKWLTHLPFCNILEEDEHHILISCPKFHQLRTELHEETKSLLLRNEDHHYLYNQPHIYRFGGYVRKIFNQRFPKTKKKKDTK